MDEEQCIELSIVIMIRAIVLKLQVLVVIHKLVDEVGHLEFMMVQYVQVVIGVHLLYLELVLLFEEVMII